MSPWEIIDLHALRDEDALVRDLIAEAAFAPEDRARITASGAKLVRQIRAAKKPGLMEVFLAEYGLSTTSPAAILLYISFVRIFIFPILFP